MHRFEKLNNLSINIFEINFHQDKKKWKHTLFPIEKNENASEKAFDLLIYKHHFALTTKLNVSLGDHHKILPAGSAEIHIQVKICQRYVNQNVTILLLLLLELLLKLIFIGKNIIMKVHSLLGFMRIPKLIIKKINLV